MKRLATVALLAMPLFAQGVPAPEGVITGLVVNSATESPVARVQVALVPADNKTTQRGRLRVSGGIVADAAGAERLPVAAVLTTGDGRFRFDGVADGEYHLQARKAGFFGMASGAVTVSNAIADPVSIRINPQSVVAGKVVDEDGEPVDNTRVQLLQRTLRRGASIWNTLASAQTDDRGQFRIVTPMAGDFLVSARPVQPIVPTSTRGAIYVTTFAPNARETSGAKPISLEPGREIADLVIRLRSSRVHSIRGRALDADGSPVKTGGVQLLPSSGEPPVAQGGVMLGEDGSFEVRQVPPGTYRVVVVVYDSSKQRAATADVKVEDSDIDGLVLRIAPPVTISGRVELPLPPIPGGAPTDIVPVEEITARPQVRIGLNPAVWDGFGRSYTAEVREDGTFSIEGVQPGKYEVGAGYQYASYLASVRLNGEEKLGKVIEISSPGDKLEIIYRADGGTLRATYEGDTPSVKGQTPTLVLVPRDEHLRRQPFLYVVPMSMGREANLPRLRPGEYFVWIFDRLGRFDRIEDPAFFQQIEPSARKLKIERDGAHDIRLKITPWP